MIRIRKEIEHLEAKISTLKEKIQKPGQVIETENIPKIRELIDAKVALSERLETIGEICQPESFETAARTLLEAAGYTESQKDSRQTAVLYKRASRIYERAAEIMHMKNSEESWINTQDNPDGIRFLKNLLKENSYRKKAYILSDQAEYYRKEADFEKFIKDMPFWKKKLIRYIKQFTYKR